MRRPQWAPQTAHRLRDEAVCADRNLPCTRGAGRVRRERHLARPIQAQPNADHRAWRARRIGDPLDWASRPSRDPDNQRPRLIGAGGLATTIRDQQQQPNHQQTSHAYSLTLTPNQEFPRCRVSARLPGVVQGLTATFWYPVLGVSRLSRSLQ